MVGIHNLVHCLTLTIVVFKLRLEIVYRFVNIGLTLTIVVFK